MNNQSISRTVAAVNGASAQDKTFAAALRDHQLDLDQQWLDGHSAFYRGVTRDACQTETIQQGWDVAAAEAVTEWHELQAPPVWEEAPALKGVPPVYIVPVTAAGLSADARDYLRRQVQHRRHDGMPVRQVAEWAREWCRGYAARNGTGSIALLPTVGYFDGEEYARGEAAYLTCMAEQVGWTDWRGPSDGVLNERGI